MEVYGGVKSGHLLAAWYTSWSVPPLPWQGGFEAKPGSQGRWAGPARSREEPMRAELGGTAWALENRSSYVAVAKGC